MAAEVPFHLRVAAYCRVSTDKEDQRNSLSAQRSFFLSYIRERPDWSLVEIFADEGLSGTSARRPQFTRMLQLAMSGGIDLILTKEVSRFARNTVDTLQITRQLKEHGVGVWFLNDNIDTRENDGEFRLTIMASVAQEESRKISERTRWGQLQAMKRGVAFGNNSIYGYTLQGGALTVDWEQAAVVRQIYQKFLDERKGTHIIARELTQAGISPPLRPGGAWSAATVLRILRNEKYTGDLLQRKYRTTDHLTHHKVPNDGTEEQFCLPSHHQAIISQADFQAVQAELERRSGMASQTARFSSRYWHSGKVRCGLCRKSLALKRTRRPGHREYTRFICRGRLNTADPCPGKAIRGEILVAAARHVLKQLPLDSSAILEQLKRELAASQALSPEETTLHSGLRQSLQRQLHRRDRLLEAYLDGVLNREDMERLSARCEEEIASLHRFLEPPEPRSGRPLQNFQALLPRLEQELEGGDAVLDEVIRQITVFEDHLLVEVNECPVGFLVRAQGLGTGEAYHVEVTECTPVPLPG